MNEIEMVDVMPNPSHWAACSTCETAYVLRRGLSISQGWVWRWQRDCKHKADPVVMTAAGRHEPQDTT